MFFCIFFFFFLLFRFFRFFFFFNDTATTEIYTLSLHDALPISLHTWASRPLDDGLIAVMNDIGSQIGEFVERKRAELALQDSEKRTRSVLDNVSDGLATLDQASVIESANPAV